MTNKLPLKCVFSSIIFASIFNFFLFNPVLVRAEFTKTFPDVPKDSTNSYFSDINNLLERGVVSGFSDGQFKPDRDLTRGEMSKFVINAFFGKDYKNESCPQFVDVATNYTFYKEIRTLKCEGVVSGFGNGIFKPEDKVTRGEALKFAIEGLKASVDKESFLTNDFYIKNSVSNLDGEKFPFQVNPVFKDVDSNHSFFNYSIIYNFSNLGDFDGYFDSNSTNPELKPNQPILRKEMAQLIFRTLMLGNFKFIDNLPKLDTSKYIEDINTIFTESIGYSDIRNDDHHFYFGIPNGSRVYTLSSIKDNGSKDMKIVILDKNFIFDKSWDDKFFGFKQNPYSTFNTADYLACYNCDVFTSKIKDLEINFNSKIKWLDAKLYTFATNGEILTVVVGEINNSSIQIEINDNVKNYIGNNGYQECVNKFPETDESLPRENAYKIDNCAFGKLLNNQNNFNNYQQKLKKFVESLSFI